MLITIRRLAHDAGGATAIEYALIASLIAISAIVAMGNVGNQVNNLFSNVSNSL